MMRIGTYAQLQHARGKAPHELGSGEYAKWRGLWYVCPPGSELVANLGNHHVTEHDNDTISVAPSILVSTRETQRHGFIDNSVWKEV